MNVVTFKPCTPNDTAPAVGGDNRNGNKNVTFAELLVVGYESKEAENACNVIHLQFTRKLNSN